MTVAATSKASHSLRKRLLWFVLVAILLAAVVQAITAYRSALQQADVMFDDHLQQVARSLGGSAQFGNGVPPGFPPFTGESERGFEIYVQVWGPDGTQLFRSRRSALPPRTVLGFSEVEAEGNRYRVYSLQTPLQTVQIAQDMNARAGRAQSLALRAVLPFALLTPLLMLAVWWIINRSLAPIERARRQLAGRAADDFSPLLNADLPDEVRPLVDELNLLFGRVRDAFNAQKNFVADAAHELRSPLTALKLQAQSLRRAEVEPAAREAGVARLNQGIDRAIRLVEQLLVLAREESAAKSEAKDKPVDLDEIVRLAIADMLPQAQIKHIDLGLHQHEAAWVHGQPEALRVLLRNLLENAVKYTPLSGRVDVGLEVIGADAVLTVEDSGPGIAVEDRLRVFDRFFRSGDAQGETGNGLGLAIVKTIADRHGATLQLDTSERLGGLCVTMRLTSLSAVKAGHATGA
jgi:two-component system, OmpR family, sensor kinase